MYCFDLFRVVVGAPLGNKTSSFRERNGYGSVYKCNSDSTRCQVIPIDDSSEYKLGEILNVKIK